MSEVELFGGPYDGRRIPTPTDGHLTVTISPMGGHPAFSPQTGVYRPDPTGRWTWSLAEEAR